MIRIYVLCLFFLLIACLTCSAEYYYTGDSSDQLDPALATLQNVKRSRIRYRSCQPWRRKCVPWTSEPRYSCCGGLSCKCNLWMQNCRCTAKLWG